MNRLFFAVSLLILSSSFNSCGKSEEDLPSTIDQNKVELQEILKLVNEIRTSGTSCGSTYYPPVDPLLWNEKLERAALKHSQDMFDQNYFSHTSLNGNSFSDRIEQEDYLYLSIGENIANGYPSEESVINGWLNSQGHCANIMNPKYTEMGVGRVGNYWTQDFGKPKK